MFVEEWQKLIKKENGFKKMTSIEREDAKGIVATVISGNEIKGLPTKFMFYTLIQSEVETAMMLMGFGSSEYWLDYGA